MTNINLKLFIDGRDAGMIHELLALRPLVSDKTKNTYWAFSKQASRYGIKVNGTILPKGLDTVLSVGTSAKTAQVVNLASTNDPTFRKGRLAVEVSGAKKVVDAGIHDFQDGSFTLMCSVHGPNGSGGTKRPALSAR